MRAVCLIESGKPLELQEIDLPKIGDADILVEVKAAGICHSDAHYRAGISAVGFLPITLGHEVSGVVKQIGQKVDNLKIGDRVCLHYLITCGYCQYCVSGHEQFCKSAKMIGHHVNGGYAEYIAIPARNAIPLPDEVSFDQGATLMCASATAYHALLKGRIKAGERVAIFGLGGLGQSAIQLARAMGASEVYGIDLNEEKLKWATKFGAIPIPAGDESAVEAIKDLTKGAGVDIAIEMIGVPQTIKQTIQSCGPMGRVVLVGLCNTPIKINTYREILANEVEVIGSNDHQLHELYELMKFVTDKKLDVSHAISRTVPLHPDEINKTLDNLEKFKSGIRTVIVP